MHSCILIGDEAGANITTGNNSVFIGYAAGDGLDAETNNLGIGTHALGGSVAGGEYNVAVGNLSLDALTSGDNNTVMGYNAGTGLTTGSSNVIIGRNAGVNTITGNDNTIMGDTAGNEMQGGASNTCIGNKAGIALTSGSNNTCVGHDAGRSGSPSGELTNQDNVLALGDENISHFYVATDSINTSDKRDKADIENFNLGLSFVEKLQPVTYKWDKRAWYSKDRSITPDGTYKKDKIEVGFLAQDILPIEQENNFGTTKDNMLFTHLNEDDTEYGMKYSRLVTVLVNAVKELSAEIKALKGE